MLELHRQTFVFDFLELSIHFFPDKLFVVIEVTKNICLICGTRVKTKHFCFTCKAFCHPNPTHGLIKELGDLKYIEKCNRCMRKGLFTTVLSLVSLFVFHCRTYCKCKATCYSNNNDEEHASFQADVCKRPQHASISTAFRARFALKTCKN